LQVFVLQIYTGFRLINFSAVYEENQKFIQTFLAEGHLDSELSTEQILLERYVDIYVYMDKPNQTFRLFATEHKTPDRQKAKVVQLFNFGLRRKKELYNQCESKEQATYELENIEKKFLLFSLKFNDQRRFQKIAANQDEITKVSGGNSKPV
jgi:hypothetical protein